MHRIDTDGAVLSMFNDGNPQIGQDGTIVDDAWLNDVQENLALAIEHAGIALAKGDGTQLWKAIAAIAAGVLGVGGEGGVGVVPTSRIVLGAGLVTGGGTLATDQTLTVAKASADDIIAGISDAEAITPYGLAGAFAGGLAADDEIRMPNGRIIKFGGLRAAGIEGQVRVDFPTPFPHACQRVLVTPVNTTASGSKDIIGQLVSSDVNGFIAMYNWVPVGTGVNSIDGLDYIAFGY